MQVVASPSNSSVGHTSGTGRTVASRSPRSSRSSCHHTPTVRRAAEAARAVVGRLRVRLRHTRQEDP